MNSAFAWQKKNLPDSGNCDQQPDLIWIGLFCISVSAGEASVDG
jgi:hypothetical protein